MKTRPPSQSILPKVATGVPGFDEITGGGLPKGRCSLICGEAGSGKTLFAMQFLASAARDLDEPGVYVTFEETPEELALNLASIGYDITELVGRKRMQVEHVYVERAELVDAGEYDLEGLFIRLNAAIDGIKAKRIVLDTLEVLFSAIPNEAILRAELRRLFHWLKKKGVSAIITAERGDKQLTRYGIEEYVSDCVVLLDHRVHQEVTTRRLRVVKYRGSSHATNEFPFLIDDRGFSVIPITALGLDHGASEQRFSTGIERLDTMLSGKGAYQGSSILISGTAGTGKSSLAMWMAAAAARRGEKCVYFAFEESSDQIVRNMRSIGNDLSPLLASRKLTIVATRASAHGLEMHLVAMIATIRQLKPAVVVLDPISNFIATGTTIEVKAMITRLIDLLKREGITGIFTSLTFGGDALEQTETTISSLMDTWMLLRTYENNGERNRGLTILKSRGMAHSNQIREFVINDRGIELVDVYLGSAGMVMGSARVSREMRDELQVTDRERKRARAQRLASQRRQEIEQRIRELQSQLEAESAEAEVDEQAETSRSAAQATARSRMASARIADAQGSPPARDAPRSPPSRRRKA